MKIGLTRTTIDSDTVRFGQASFSPLPIGSTLLSSNANEKGNVFPKMIKI